jgi:hypothetical protein
MQEEKTGEQVIPCAGDEGFIRRYSVLTIRLRGII